MFSTGGGVVDLLGDFLAKQGKRCHVVRRPDGLASVVNATSIQLDKSSDMERIIGLLLGKKACRKEMQRVVKQMHEMSQSQVDDLSPSMHLLDSTEATMLISINVSPLTAGKQSPIHFHFLCPYGDCWASPSQDLCLFAETLACFPHTPPSSVLKESLLTQMLLDPVLPADFVCVANVSQSMKDAVAPSASKSYPQFCSAINANSFRTLKQPPRLSDSSALSEGEQGELIQKALQVLRVVSHMPKAL